MAISLHPNLEVKLASELSSGGTLEDSSSPDPTRMGALDSGASLTLLMPAVPPPASPNGPPSQAGFESLKL